MHNRAIQTADVPRLRPFNEAEEVLQDLAELEVALAAEVERLALARPEGGPVGRRQLPRQADLVVEGDAGVVGVCARDGASMSQCRSQGAAAHAQGCR